MPGLLSDVLNMVRRVPGVGSVERELAAIERVVLGALQRRLESVAEDHHLEEGSNGGVPPLGETMDRMLRRSMDQTASDSRRSLFEHVLGELVPDEARILAALADGSSYPLLDVAVARRGAEARVVLGNASNVGRAAGVAVPSLVPTYVTHLLRLGLAEASQEDAKLEDEYQILLTEAEVRSARAEAAKAARSGTRIRRGTLRISPLGRDFWAACQLEREGG